VNKAIRNGVQWTKRSGREVVSHPAISMDFDEIATVLHTLTAGDRGEGRHSGNEASDHKRTEHLEAKGLRGLC
jgi:hypothetical protein